MIEVKCDLCKKPGASDSFELPWGEFRIRIIIPQDVRSNLHVCGSCLLEFLTKRNHGLDLDVKKANIKP